MPNGDRRFANTARQGVLIIMLISAISCGGRGGSPTRPTPTTEPEPQPAPEPQTWTLSGTVSETAPTESIGIAGATVTVYDSPDLGRSATTDAKGAFQITQLHPGSLALNIQAAGYVESKQAVTLSGNQGVTLELDPVSQLVTNTYNDSISGAETCPGGWDYAVALRLTAAAHECEVDYVVNVHHNGMLTAALTWPDQNTSPSIEFYRARAGQAEGPPLQVIEDSTHISGDLYAHVQYIVQVHRFSTNGAPPPPGTSSFSLTMTHPN